LEGDSRRLFKTYRRKKQYSQRNERILVSPIFERKVEEKKDQGRKIAKKGGRSFLRPGEL